jgi:AsmA protein
LQIGGFAKLALFPRLGLIVQDVSVEDATTGVQVFSAKRARYGIALNSLLRGQIRVTDVALTRPTLRIGRWSGGTIREPSTTRADDERLARVGNMVRMFTLEEFTADDCILVLDNGQDMTELKLDAVHLNSSLAPDDRLTLEIEARSRTNIVAARATVDAPDQLLAGKSVRVAATIEPRGMQSPIAVAANVQVLGPVLRIDNAESTFARGHVDGSLSVSFARAKPFLDADINVEHLDLADVVPASTNGGYVGAQTSDDNEKANAISLWSDRPMSFTALRLFEADARIAARELVIDKVHLGQTALEVTLLDDELSVVLPRTELYGGDGAGELVVNASSQALDLSVRFDLSGADVLPLLSDAADFPYLVGRGGTKLDLKGSGESPLRIVSSLEGTASFLLENGEVRGIDVPNMLQLLLKTILSGWQTNTSDRTKFSTFSASFRAKDGQASTDDLSFAGSIVSVTGSGTANLVDRTLNLRLDPQLVSSATGQPGGPESWSIGVPVIVRGPWANPQIYADLPGIMINPADALGRLRPGEKNLLGPPGSRPDSWLKTLDQLIGGRGSR